MINEQDKRTMATCDAIVRTLSQVMQGIQNPSNTTYYRNPTMECKVAASLNKKLAKHYTRAG